MYNVVLVLSIEQSDSVIHMCVCVCMCVCVYIYIKVYIYILFRFFSLLGHYKILSTVPCAIQ